MASQRESASYCPWWRWVSSVLGIDSVVSQCHAAASQLRHNRWASSCATLTSFRIEHMTDAERQQPDVHPGRAAVQPPVPPVGAVAALSQPPAAAALQQAATTPQPAASSHAAAPAPAAVGETLAQQQQDTIVQVRA